MDDQGLIKGISYPILAEGFHVSRSVARMTLQAGEHRIYPGPVKTCFRLHDILALSGSFEPRERIKDNENRHDCTSK
jgi:hypothetical protein